MTTFNVNLGERNLHISVQMMVVYNDSIIPTWQWTVSGYI